MFSSIETHIVVDCNDSRTLAVKNDDDVKSVDVVSRDQDMSMLVMPGGASRAQMEIYFMIFQTKDSSYIIRRLLDEISFVCYQSGARGWMDLKVFEERLNEKRIMSRFPDN